MITDSSVQHVAEIYHQPLMDLLFQAQKIHRDFHPANEVQICRLLSIKTGGCPEDCAYCPQSAHYQAGVERRPLMSEAEILTAARLAKADGATRFCMGAAWRQAPAGKEFESLLESVRAVSQLGMEVCCTLGMLTPGQAVQLKDAGLTAYNHNLDTSPEFYGTIITTRQYHERLNTIAAVRQAGITVCCGGIVGMGETDNDRINFLHQLAALRPHPESVPINMLVRAAGTPLSPRHLAVLWPASI
jgi:biotin synthase